MTIFLVFVFPSTLFAFCHFPTFSHCYFCHSYIHRFSPLTIACKTKQENIILSLFWYLRCITVLSSVPCIVFFFSLFGSSWTLLSSVHGFSFRTYMIYQSFSSASNRLHLAYSSIQSNSSKLCAHFPWPMILLKCFFLQKNRFVFALLFCFSLRVLCVLALSRSVFFSQSIFLSCLVHWSFS